MKRQPEGLRRRDQSAVSARQKFSGAPRSMGCCYPHCSRPHCSQKVAGFTLTEVLIVAVVIGVLLSFITAAAFSALTRGQEFAIQTEVGKLALAMEAFKQQYGSYPPAELDESQISADPDRLTTILSARAFPRYIQRLATDPEFGGHVIAAEIAE